MLSLSGPMHLPLCSDPPSAKQQRISRLIFSLMFFCNIKNVETMGYGHRFGCTPKRSIWKYSGSTLEASSASQMNFINLQLLPICMEQHNPPILPERLPLQFKAITCPYLFQVLYWFRLPCLVHKIILGYSGAENPHYLMFKELEVSKFGLVSCHFQDYAHPALGRFFTSAKVLGSTYEFGALDCRS